MTTNPWPPSILVFGPQTELPSEEALSDLRHELVGNPRLSALRKGVAELPRVWESLVASDADLGAVPGSENLGRLAQWLAGSGSLPRGGEEGAAAAVPNHYGLAVTVLLQISQYVRYLDLVEGGGHREGGEEDAHGRVLGAVGGSSSGGGGGGVQGFCVGLLSAVAVAGAKEGTVLGTAAAVALRLAVCIGAYVDRDGVFAPEPSQTQCVAVRWKDGAGAEKAALDATIRSFPQVRDISPRRVAGQQPLPC